MKNIEEIKLMEIEALSDFENHIGTLLSDMDIFREYLDKKDLKKFNKCYDYLDNLWEKVEDIIAKISDADERNRDK